MPSVSTVPRNPRYLSNPFNYSVNKIPINFPKKEKEFSFVSNTFLDSHRCKIKYVVYGGKYTYTHRERERENVENRVLSAEGNTVIR